jgi:hypothetical protein
MLFLGIIATGKESAVLHAVSDGASTSEKQAKNTEMVLEEKTSSSDEELQHKMETEIFPHRKVHSPVIGETHYAIKVCIKICFEVYELHFIRSIRQL